MNTNDQKDLGRNNAIVFIGLIASIIGIFVFITNITSVSRLIEIFRSKISTTSHATSNRPEELLITEQNPHSSSEKPSTPQELKTTPKHRLTLKIESRDPWSDENEKLEDNYKFEGLSDIISIIENNTIIRTYEFYTSGKSKDLLDYPWTAKAFESLMTTNLVAEVADLDFDGNDEVLIWISNRVYGAHEDHQISFVITDHNGKIILTTKLPESISALQIQETPPYSAYNNIGVLVDKISREALSLPLANLISFSQYEGNSYISFGWVIDGAGYPSEHLYQIDTYKYEYGKLIPERKYGRFLYFGYGYGHEKINLASLDNNLERAKRFLEDNFLPIKSLMRSNTPFPEQ